MDFCISIRPSPLLLIEGDVTTLPIDGSLYEMPGGINPLFFLSIGKAGGKGEAVVFFSFTVCFEFSLCFFQ